MKIVVRLQYPFFIRKCRAKNKYESIFKTQNAKYKTDV